MQRGPKGKDRGGMARIPDHQGTERGFRKAEIQVQRGLDELSRAAASQFLQEARRAVQEKGLFSVALAGGSTPRPLYALLAEDPSFRTEIPWGKTYFFWGDERPVPPDHPESNYRMANEAMLSKVPVPSENIHRIRAENPDASRVAMEYEETLRTFFRPKAGEFPRFDLVLLGMGPDGHTASLFPGTEGLGERKRLVVANWVDQLHGHRITMTLPVLNQAAFVLFLVSGEEKAETLRRVFQDGGPKDPLPAQRVQPTHGRLLWLVDQDAGRLLEPVREERRDTL
jgi:6-phosphogluconolactonase